MSLNFHFNYMDEHVRNNLGRFSQRKLDPDGAINAQLNYWFRRTWRRISV